jgi:hypothetical protein
MDSRFRPDDLGDLGVLHEVNVFVFRVTPRGLEYLLVQPRPRQEAVWRPVIEAVDLQDDLFRAAVRGVRSETGLDYAFDLVAPAPGLLHHQGDLQRIEWPFGYRLRDPNMPVRCREQLAAFSWQGFDDALRTLGMETHRQNLLQLHWRLLAA